MRLCVLGAGYVGSVLAACLARDGHDVVAVDKDPAKVDRLNQGRAPVAEPGLDDLVDQAIRAGRLTATTNERVAVVASNVVFVCVGTPPLADGSFDGSAVARASESIGAALRDHPGRPSVVVRSTMLPGSLDELVVRTIETKSGRRHGSGFGAAHMPEFLREGSAIADYDDPAVVVIGTADGPTVEMLRKIFGHLPAELRVVDARSAEAVKYVSNAWHAAKVAFANEVGSLAKATGLDGNVLMDILAADRRLNISQAYLKPGFAFGGSCLPKDLMALTRHARDAGVITPVLNAILPSNAAIIERAAAIVASLPARRVGIVGLAFKPGTDDFRESPLAALAGKLLAVGKDVRIFEPALGVDRLAGANREALLAQLPNVAALTIPDERALLAHAEVAVLGNAPLARGLLPGLEKTGAFIVDLVRARDASSGDRYIGLHW